MTPRRKPRVATIALPALTAVALVCLAAPAAAPPPAAAAEPAWPGPRSFVLPERAYRLDAPPGGSRTVSDLGAGRVRVAFRDAAGRVTAEAEGTADRYEDVVFHRATPEGYDLHIPILNGDPEGATPAPRREQARCGSSARNPGSFQWPLGRTFRWFVVTSSIPRGVDRGRAVRAMRDGRIAWSSVRDHCGIPDRAVIAFDFRGSTRASSGANGINTVGFGSPRACGAPGSGSLQPLACAPTYVSGRTVVEADIRYNVNRRWTTRGTRGTGGCSPCDIQGVATHETGHQLGFGHVAGDDNVMSASFGSLAESVSARRLGRGDAIGVNARY